MCDYMLVLHVLKHCMGNSQLSHVVYEAMAIATMQQQQQSASQSTSESQSQSQKLMQKQKQVKQSTSCSGEWDKTIYHVCNSHEKFMQIERSVRRKRLQRRVGRECLSIAGNGSQIVVGEIIISCRSRRRRRSRCWSHILNWDVKLALRRCQSIRQTQCTCCSFG